MPALQIRDLPKDLYQSLRRRAEQERRSLAQEAVVLLEKGLSSPLDARERRRKVLAEVAARPVELPAKAPTPDAIVREDRER